MNLRVVAASMALSMSAATAARAGDPAEERRACADASERAQELRTGGKLREARADLLTCVREICPDVVRTDCVGWLEEIERLLPTVVLGARDARGHDLADVSVQMDGEVLSERITGQPIAVNPGEHAFRFARPGAAPIELRAVIRAGDKGRALIVSFPDAARPAPTPGNGRMVGTAVLGGFGLAAVGVGIFLEVKGTTEIDELRESPCAAGRTCDVDGARAKLLAGDISIATGIVAIGVATVLFLTRPRGSKPAPASAMVLAF